MKTKRTLAVLLGIIMIIISVVLLKSDKVDFSEKYVNAGNIDENIDGLVRENTYGIYLETHQDKNMPSEDLMVPISEYQVIEVGDENVDILENVDGAELAVFCPEESLVQWQVDVEEAGMYQIQVDYYAPSSRGADIERKLLINGRVPFSGADALIFTRAWHDKDEPTIDNQGNELRASQVDVPMWMSASMKDNLGYFTQPYSFYFDKGINTIALEAVTEPMLIKSMTLKAIKSTQDYATYTAAYQGAPVQAQANTYVQVIQGEDAIYRSSPSLYPVYDRSAPNTVPYSVNEIVLNMIGGYPWRVPGQWIEWQFEVPADGFYHLTFKARQNYSRGFVSNRSIYIDGQIPFEELSAVAFEYDNNWNNTTLADENEVAYDFYLEKGIHTVKMEATLGALGDIVNDMEDSVFRLNAIYRKILVLTGATPDQYRDYQIDRVYPEVIEAMDIESKRLYRLIDRIVAYTGQKASQVATAQTLAEQLERFVDDPTDIPKVFQTFKDNISALGTSTRTLSEAPLDIDLITITGRETEPKDVKSGFVAKTLHEIRSFTASFVNDYNAIGNVYNTDASLEVWILTGRDQSTILKSMIDDDFTPKTGIHVNLKLVEAGTVLNAVIAGKGPDIVLSLGQGEPVNYALRNAVEDLTQFSDYSEVLEQFDESAYTPYWFEGGLYALPETQNFNVLFYRKDIMEELGLEIPNTWDDLIAMLPTIQQENLSVAIPSTERLIGNVSAPDVSCLFALNYQNGGALYNEDGSKTVIDSPQGIKAFETYTDLFNQYGLPLTYDFPNRFRSGEMPLGIQDFSLYNTLVVFAPEIRGLWDFTLIPGTVMPNGEINRAAHTTGTNCLMLKQDEDVMKIMGWEFMKWWVSAPTQRKFGMEMESVMGASARYPTANLEAFQQLTWSKEQLKVLEEQRSYTVGQMEIAGGYYTPRHITNAIRKVINEKEDAREVLLDYVITINEEIRKKREEFGLEVNTDVK